ncbi:ATP-dependent helicase RIS1 [Arthroderma uncinatum]|uniref:ATP-dependent helicase RIS1 n=1 Tax=Arthroderma uncinatum TaxID=74035 RepID=UPI00144AE98E|nr:ATP-dependent helicase RIS1 [Arthroderma uncinatum]KAF3492337.1 ATP-dependent helicase RIS1 [Arthroderma uncinatum]
MVKEGEPPKIPPIMGGEVKPQPPRAAEFGKPSPLGPMNMNQRHPFVIPKVNRPRPEHHRPAPSSTLNDNASKEKDKRAINPFQATKLSSFNKHSPITLSDDDSVVEIMKPMNADRTTKRAPEPLFTSKPSAPKMGKAASTLKNFMDLTTPDVGFGSTNTSFREEVVGSADAYSYVDSEKANENIKALLEGAFEDEDDKPRTRSRKKKIDKQVDELADKLMGIDGVAWMRDKETGLKKTRGVLPKGGILADDMGLGKTVQAIALLLTNPRPPTSSKDEEEGLDKGKGKKDKSKIPANVSKSTLVVAPLALIKQWEGEIESKIERSHRLSVCIYHGAGRTKHRDDLDSFDVVITTYGTLSSEHGKNSGCFGVHWYRIILDEAHTIKNRNAKATQAVYALRSLYRWCLTGTPLQNNLDELQSLIRFLQIKPYDELAAWREQITRPMNNGRGGLALRRLQVYLKAFMKRRTKDVLKLDAKPDTEDTNENEVNDDGKKKPASPRFKIMKRDIIKIEAEFSSQEWAFYQRLEQRADRSLERMMGGQTMSYAGALVLLLRLRQACNHPDLVKGELAKEQDALLGDDSQSKNKENDMDSIADMLGGLSMATKKCDVCQIELTKEEGLGGSARCTECEEDLKTQVIISDTTKEKLEKKKKKKRKSKQAPTHVDRKTERESQRARSRRVRPIVIDSDDEDEDGECIVPEEQRDSETLDAPVGPDGEDAEGGGDWIGSEDSETDEDETEIATDEDEEEEEEDDDNEELSDSTPSAIHDVQTSAKIRHLMRILKRESGEFKFIVFSVFTSMLDKIEPFLKNGGIGYARYDGGMRNDLREASLNRLRNSSGTRVLLCSLRAGSLGLNLTAASRVVILEPFWNPFVEEQAIDRVHRLNQTVDVKVYKLTIKGTVEERILELQDRKRELAKSTIEGKSAAGKLTMKDMLALFGRDAETRSWDDGKISFTTKSNKLLDAKEETTMAAAGSQAGGGRGFGKRATPPVMERKSSGSAKREDPIYGRRW